MKGMVTNYWNIAVNIDLQTLTYLLFITTKTSFIPTLVMRKQNRREVG